MSLYAPVPSRSFMSLAATPDTCCGASHHICISCISRDTKALHYLSSRACPSAITRGLLLATSSMFGVMPRTGPSALSLSLAAVACVNVSASAWLDCNSRPENLMSLSQNLQSDGGWPLGGVVVVEGFVGAVNAEQHEFSVSVRFHPSATTGLHETLTGTSTTCYMPVLLVLWMSCKLQVVTTIFDNLIPKR